MLIQMVTIKVEPGNREAFLKAFADNCEGTRKEPGNLRFDMLQSATDDHEFSVFEVFESEEALEAHRRTAHYRRCVETIEPITLGGRTKTYYEPVSVERRDGSAVEP